MNIKQPVINTFKRVGINHEPLVARNDEKVRVENIFGYGSVETTPLIAKCIQWVYDTSLAYENGDRTVNVSDFDRVRYFVLAQDSEAYMTCLD